MVPVHQNNKYNNKRIDQATGKSSGRLTTKIHLSTDEAGRINNLLITSGQTADITVALDLLQAIKATKLIAAKAYDSDWLLYYLDSESIETVIPPKKSRLQQRIIDYTAYKQRNAIEKTTIKLKQYRKIVTSYKKTAASFLSLCCITATFINLNFLEVNKNLVDALKKLMLKFVLLSR